MGCSNKKEKPARLSVEYSSHSLPEIPPDLIENEFIKEAFMVINLIRSEPMLFIPRIKEIKNNTNFRGQNVQLLINHLKTMRPMPPVVLCPKACQACRRNTEKKGNRVSLDAGFEKGGNMQEYQGIEKGAQARDECTIVGWTGTASELIFFNLVEGFEREGQHPITSEWLVAVGLSFQAHKRYENVFQILYITKPPVNDVI